MKYTTLLNYWKKITNVKDSLARMGQDIFKYWTGFTGNYIRKKVIMYALDGLAPSPRTDMKLKSHNEDQVNYSNLCNSGGVGGGNRRTWGEETEGETEGETENETKKDMTNWEKVMALVRADFREGRLAEESMWQAVVLIPKGGGDYRGIGLMEVVWEVVAEIINRQTTASITYHNIFHGFQAGRGNPLPPWVSGPLPATWILPPAALP